MSSDSGLPVLLRSFFEDFLAGQRDLSPNTIAAYRDALKLFLQFAARSSGRQVVRLELSDLGPTTVLSFLDHLESERKNSVATRNYRLVAIHRFFTYVGDRAPEHVDLCRRIMDVPIKRTKTGNMTYLTRDEVKALLASPSNAHSLGRRDRALLTFLYNTGARVSEAVGVNREDLRLDSPGQVHLMGKGRKRRVCPLWPETVNALHDHLRSPGPEHPPEAAVFCNAHGRRLTRYGAGVILERHINAAKTVQPSLDRKQISPHTMRHTAAMHLLQAGVELNVIKAWLGHVSITTTSQYIEIDMEMKRKALESCTPPMPAPTGDTPWHSRQDIIQWLTDL
jgi:site-specific recombinase XerD